MANRDQLNQGICIFVLIFCTKFIIASDSKKCTKHDHLYVIRSTGPSGLVLDATDPDQMRVQHFTGAEVQLWKFQPGLRPGLYTIINEHHRKALDVVLGDEGYLRAAVTEVQKNSLLQQWNFSIKGFISNAVTEKNIDIHHAIFNPGNDVIAWENNGCHCQKFILQKKS